MDAQKPMAVFVATHNSNQPTKPSGMRPPALKHPQSLADQG